MPLPRFLTITDIRGGEARFSYRAALWRSHLIQNSFVWSPNWFSWPASLTKWHSYWTDNDHCANLSVYLVQKRLDRYRAGEKLDDFFAYILDDKYVNSNNYLIGEMAAETGFMLNAGSDTTGIALTHVLYWLLKNPSCLSRLRAEIYAVLEHDDTVAPYDKVKHLPYLRACLDESLRLTPPNIMSVNRIIPPEGMSTRATGSRVIQLYMHRHMPRTDTRMSFHTPNCLARIDGSVRAQKHSNPTLSPSAHELEIALDGA